jgi:hypothetical protein
VGGSCYEWEYTSDADVANFLLFGSRISPADISLVYCSGRILNMLKLILTLHKNTNTG